MTNQKWKMENEFPYKSAIITLLTDYGSQDYFVGTMKGVILSINPKACIVDITHEIPPQDIHAGAFNLLASYQTFPSGTIHVAVVDPGVGSARRGVLVECAGQFFVGPDNGLFSWVCERERKFRAVHLINEKFFRRPVSETFHGRDVFAPVAAALSNGVAPQEFGDPISDPVRLESLTPTVVGPGVVKAAIIYIDRFGNCITNLTRENLSSDEVGARLVVGDREIRSFRRFFAEESEEDVFCLSGSAGFWEIAVRNGSAARVLNVERGQRMTLLTHRVT
jgi:S-adenosylmethionine hydrolase